ncbi:MAG TPA: SOS response-associated peptidase [Thermomicrobiales bacterium]|nr:SOS response-associated peptidase [Thermomicrobiales bacterium]
MCGRYTLKNVEDLSERFQVRQVPLELASTYNIAPSQELPVIVEAEDGERDVRLMQWGLIPRWQRVGHAGGVAPINARAESVAEKPMFRELIRRRRCLIPASGFYEWRQLQERKQPYYIEVKDQPLFAFAGLYDEVEQGGCAPVASFAVITTRANALLAPIHDRMPVIVRPEDEWLWLSKDVTDVGALAPVMAPLDPDVFVAFPVTTAVNNVRHDGPELIRPRPAVLPLAS